MTVERATERIDVLPASDIRDFTPRNPRALAAWPETGSAVRAAVSASTAAPACAAKYMGHLADFAGWALEQGIPLEYHSLFDPEAIERYIEVGLPGMAEGTRATRRAILRRVARLSAPQPQRPLPQPIAYRRVRPPYAPAEVAGFLDLAAAQPTPSRRRGLLGILHLGLGCGLASQDLAWVRGCDVVQSQGGAVAVTVSGGTRPRTVIALRAHEERLLELARGVGDGLLIGGRVCGRRNVTRGPLDDVIGGHDLPRLQPARLRSTWLLWHLEARTPLAVLMPAAGLTTVRPLEDLIEFCPTLGQDEHAQFLRGG